jgi:hypothetical protein
MKVMAKLIWSMTLLAMLSVVFPSGALSLPLLPFTYGGQEQPIGVAIVTGRWGSSAECKDAYY